jgi:hypothetical protein
MVASSTYNSATGGDTGKYKLPAHSQGASFARDTDPMDIDSDDQADTGSTDETNPIDIDSPSGTNATDNDRPGKTDPMDIDSSDSDTETIDHVNSPNTTDINNDTPPTTTIRYSYLEETSTASSSVSQSVSVVITRHNDK